MMLDCPPRPDQSWALQPSCGRRRRPATFTAAEAYELLVESVVDYAIYMLDPDGHVVSRNPGAQRIKGYAPEEIIGEHFSRFYVEEERAAGVPEQALRTAAEAGRFTAEGWRLRKDGSRFWAMVVIDPIRRGGALVGFAKVTRDLTERHEAQLRLEQSREQLVQAQKMEALGQLTGGLAHDFNNLLTAVLGSLELTRRRVAQGRIGDLDRHLSVAQGAASRAASLTQRLLAFARRQTLDPKPVDANRLVAGMAELIQRTAGPEIRVETLLADGLWPTLCDPNQLESALLNLCINARDAMPDGGRLTIGTASTSLDERCARELDLHPGQYVTLAVTDTGTGMSLEVVNRAFDPFFTTKPLGQGTGLGLSMTYGFARQSHGQVRIRSELGMGTTVCIYLPRYHGEIAGEHVRDELADVPRAQAGETVLVVDDEPAVRGLVVEALEELGYAAVEAGDGASGLDVLRSGVRVDLLVTDVGLPGGMNGRQLADAARVCRAGLKVLFMTGYAGAAAVGNGQLGPGMQVITKPFTVSALAAQVRTIIARS